MHSTPVENVLILSFDGFHDLGLFVRFFALPLFDSAKLLKGGLTSFVSV